MNSLLKITVLSLVLTMSEALYPKSHVTIADTINGNPITAHCYSVDDDLGTHQLFFQQQFSWTFRYKLIGETRFYCDINTQFGQGKFRVYDNDKLVNQCGLNCVWQVQPNGPCLQLKQGGQSCEPWQ
ncbi:hypothetical protein CDL12_08192 [Handroanthus impetiginosus]|uniref:S-protein homolog n=1 Tax=Handroanthus impetiginosus TaxID=429701 RepID=A0A2G9HNN4_9LAMI|nr:hypothetical protein CDL12_08192 [Handroanthus impetiginosus]